MLRRITVLNGSFYLGAAVIKKAENKSTTDTSEQNSTDFSHYKCKRSELPLYTPLHELNK